MKYMWLFNRRIMIGIGYPFISPGCVRPMHDCYWRISIFGIYFAIKVKDGWKKVRRNLLGE